MPGWTIHDGQAVALPLESIDTDQLIPARFMSVPRSEGYGRYLLHDLAHGADGAVLPDFPLNRYPGATVLVTRRNFGSGSSREAAVYALVDFGIRVVIAPSFGDIFAGNAVNNGLLPARLPAEVVEQMIAALGDGTGAAHIDLDRASVSVAGIEHAVEIEPVARAKLINGWDDIDLTASHGAEIAAYREARRARHPWAWPRQTG
jgi:3-isopropylmalate/(R)-2-methylmalate dehydratase small subunit